MFKKWFCNHVYVEIGDMKTTYGYGYEQRTMVEKVLFCPNCDKELRCSKAEAELILAKQFIKVNTGGEQW